jgi:hypothetical protein
LRILTLVFVGVFGALHIAPAVACTADEITLADGTCKPVQFTMDVTSEEPSDGFDFSFSFNAKGTLYIDWGDNSGIQTVTKNNTNNQRSVTHTFYQTSTIRLSGEFTEYSSKNGRSYSVIKVSNDYLVGIGGSLGALFPTLTNVASPGNQPLFQETFKNCTNLKGPIPAELFDGITGTARSNMFREMFAGCTQLDGYIPYNLFDGITGISSSNMNYIFNNTPALATTSTGCPNRTTQVTTGYESFWNGHIACKPDAVACDHAYNGVCPDLCSFATQLKTSTGLSFPLFANKVTSVAINIRQNGVTCYVPLEAGNGGTGSLNLTYNNTTYHAGVLDN